MLSEEHPFDDDLGEQLTLAVGQRSGSRTGCQSNCRS